MLSIYTINEFKEKFLNVSTIAKPSILESVQAICKAVYCKRDEAVFHYTSLYDAVDLSSSGMKVSDSEIQAAYQEISSEWLQSLELATQNIRSFHVQQREKSWMDTDDAGTIRGQLVKPLNRVGIYVPGGTAAYPSSVLMNAIPAQVAGVAEIVMVTPPNKEGAIKAETLVAAAELGISEIYKVGGAQAVSALAYGTESIPKVDKIVGPGNIYVTLAKKEVFGIVDIDMLAGPSEVCIIADDSAEPSWVAADLLAQAEHDPMARVVLITTEQQLAKDVQDEVVQQLRKLPRASIAKRSVTEYGAIVITANLDEAMSLANEFAPEHLELSLSHAFELLPFVKNAGAVFVGHYSAESVGDYIAGPNHVLPTGGSSRFFSALGVQDFYKRIGLLSYSRKSLSNTAEHVIRLAENEGLQGHAEAVKRRIDSE